MLLLEACNIKKYYNDKLIIKFDKLKIHSKNRIGIIGLNGSGKTTLLNILSGEIKPDTGFVRQYCDITYIRQFSDEKISAGQKILSELNLIQKSHQEVFSGGEKTRIKLANAFSRENLLLFADEPAAHLDYKGIEILKEKLLKIESFILISHDRYLLDCLCNKILEIRDEKIKLYKGNYSAYRMQNDILYKNAEKEYEKYSCTKNSIENAMADRKIKSSSMKKTPKRMGNSEARLHKRSTTKKQKKVNNVVNSLKTRLEKLETKGKPKKPLKIKLDFSITNPPENKIVISVKNLTFSYGSRKIFNNANFNVINGSKTALWGENGTGKSTLLNLIKDNAHRSIYIVPKAKIGYLYQNFENLNFEKTVLENVMEDSVQTQTAARTILARLLILNSSVHKKVGCLSGGEKIKVSFAKLFVSDANILLLDEPANYLDMHSIEALENVLCDYEGTVLFVSHDRAFINKAADRLLVIENKTVKEFEGTFDKYQLCEKLKKNDENDIEQTVLQMKITKVLTKLSQADSDKEALEEEYEQLILRLKNKNN